MDAWPPCGWIWIVDQEVWSQKFSWSLPWYLQCNIILMVSYHESGQTQKFCRVCTVHSAHCTVARYSEYEKIQNLVKMNFYPHRLCFDTRRNWILRDGWMLNRSVLFKLIRPVFSKSTLDEDPPPNSQFHTHPHLRRPWQKNGPISAASPCVSPRRCWITVKLLKITHNLVGLLAFALVFLQTASSDRFPEITLIILIFFPTVVLSLTTW